MTDGCLAGKNFILLMWFIIPVYLNCTLRYKAYQAILNKAILNYMSRCSQTSQLCILCKRLPQFCLHNLFLQPHYLPCFLTHRRSEMSPWWDLFVFLLHHTCATAMDQEGGAERAAQWCDWGYSCCLPHSELWHGEVLWSISQKNTWQPQGKTGMGLHGKSRSLSLRKSFLTLHVQDIIESITAAHSQTGESRDLCGLRTNSSQAHAPTNFGILSHSSIYSNKTNC